MALTASTDGAVIVSTRWRSTCFVVRIMVSSCGRSPSDATDTQAEWSFVAASEIGGHLFRPRTDSLSGDELTQKALQSYLFLFSLMENIRFPLSHAHGEFLTLNDQNPGCVLEKHSKLAT